MQRAYEKGIKQISMIDMASKETRKQSNKRESKQTRKQTKGGVCEGQCRFGLNVHNLIVLKHRRHTGKQDLCMNI